MEINFEETRYGRIRINWMRKLKIIQILPSLNTGGVERGVLDLINIWLLKAINPT